MSATQLSNNHFLWEYRKSLVLRFHTRYEYVGLFNEGLIALDDEGRILAANDSAVGMLGYPGRKDLVNRKIHEVVDVTMDRLLASVRTSVSTVWPMHEMIGGHQFFAMACSAQADWLPGASAVRDVSPADSQLTLADVGGSDPQMMRLADTARRVADKKIPILLLGETGTGKEVLARAIHAASDRADQAFVTLNCSALSESVIESELFGYTHGTFTGARRKEFKGRLILSDGGTIFLDEIGDMPAQLQSRLLRVLEDGVVTPLGSDRAVKVELNVISATNKSLEKMIADGRFRADLYYRLGGVCLSLAPLRARTDCGELIRKIVAAESRLGRVPSISAEALERLSCQSWPGNIRQLRHAVKAALALCEGNELLASDFAAACPSGPARALVLPADEASSGRGGEAAGDAAGPDPLALAERHAIVHALQCANGNVSKAARELSISRNTLYRKLKRHDIDLASIV